MKYIGALSFVKEFVHIELIILDQLLLHSALLIHLRCALLTALIHGNSIILVTQCVLGLLAKEYLIKLGESRCVFN